MASAVTQAVSAVTEVVTEAVTEAVTTVTSALPSVAPDVTSDVVPYDPSLVWLVVTSFLVAFTLAFGIGANDVANVFGTSVGAKAITLRNACIIATIGEMLGAMLIGYKVSETMRKGILDVGLYQNNEKELMLGSLAALGGSAIWNLLATFLRLPISGTHTIVGATIGFSLVARGADGVNWRTFGKIVASWFLSPVLSGIISICLFLIVRTLVLRRPEPVEPGLRSLPFFYGFTILINVFSVVHDGPSLLYLDKLPVWAVVLISVAAGLIVAIGVQLLLVPRLRRQIKETSRLPSPDVSKGPTPTISMEKLSQTLSPSEEAAARPQGAAATYAFNGETAANNGYIAATTLQVPSIQSAVSSENGSAPVKNGGSIPGNASQLPLVGGGVDARKNSNVLPIAAARELRELSRPEPPEVARLFAALQVMTASFGSFAHGGNDVSNAIGPLIAVWLIFMEGSVAQKAETPVYILFYGGVGISVGLWVWGRRVIKTIGEDLTQLTPSSGFTIELGAAFTVLFASKIGLPVSTTHCKVGSVVFVGWARSTRAGVDWKVFRNIIIAWLVTVPFAAAASAALMALFRAVAL
ncbi:sodium-dependent phosphate transporter 2-like isoform X2 [Amphibalanus amphitrite]|uniref:sodium-dependent phosphate transporter 2-like isoform X2 n=1 Tax=Amphibalanus amphitrite TaxID=1232801 RepID=UPI001C923748|nr:sodium-dependent phosphate transporter 2-like isoform X2 [Amphibalanus amphitrite]